MKRYISLSLLSMILMAALMASHTAHAQQIANNPSLISYQGMLTSSDGTPVPDGEYPVIVTLYADENGASRVWQDTYHTMIQGGVFSVYLGSGNVPLPAPSQMDKTLWIGTQIAGGEEMRPLTRLSASPYAINVPDNAITTQKLADGAVTADKVNLDYISGVSVNGKKVAIDGKVLNIQAGKDIDVRYDETTKSLVIGTAVGSDGKENSDAKDKERGLLGGQFDAWAMEGNGVNPAGTAIIPPDINDYIGTRLNSPIVTFTVKVNGERVMYYQPNGTLTPTIIGGHQSNTAPLTGNGNIIAGGGGAGTPNKIDGTQYNVISGGVDNIILNAGSFGGVIGGGQLNRIGAAGTVVHYGTISGGLNNKGTGHLWTIAGGRDHSVSVDYATAGGGIGSNITGWIGTVAGGDGNEVHGVKGAIIGGYRNKIFSNADHATIAGGYTNTINGSLGSIGGGQNNLIDGRNSTIAGGVQNHIIPSGNYATIGGGNGNQTQSTATTIAGGEQNTIGASYSAIGGGKSNIIDNIYSMIGGGSTNIITGQYSVIGGGLTNSIQNAGTFGGTIAGGQSNVIGSVATLVGYGTIGGGLLNQVTATYGTIAGGRSSTVSAVHGSVGGGIGNIIGSTAPLGTIAGGDGNQVHATNASIGGGYHNQIVGNGYAAAIPGGENLIAQSYGQTVVGLYNNPRGNISPGDPFNDDPIFIVGNGDIYNTGTQSNAFEVSYNGHSTVFGGTNGTTPVISGSTYTDNVIYAWGDFDGSSGTTISSFGANIIPMGPGEYRVVMNIIDPNGSTVLLDNGNSVTATIRSNTQPGNGWKGSCAIISVSEVVNNEFDVYIADPGCGPVDERFTFKVTGRP